MQETGFKSLTQPSEQLGEITESVDAASQALMGDIAGNNGSDNSGPEATAEARAVVNNGVTAGGQDIASERASSQFAEQVDNYSVAFKQIKAALLERVLGQDAAIEACLCGLIANGHILLKGVPGLGKTLLMETLAYVFSLDWRRVQCTPDLMPNDILGSEILDQNQQGQRNLRFVPGPVFTQFLMVDEINRASPRTQSALLQAMQERSITISGQVQKLPAPFYVVATQNPLEFEGTYPLPEAQIDRFMIEVIMDYPDAVIEQKIMTKSLVNNDSHRQALLESKYLVDASTLAHALPLSEQFIQGVSKLISMTRPRTSHAFNPVTEHLELGASTRGGQALIGMCKARALIDGRLSPSLDDLKIMAFPVLRHRLILNYRAQAEGITADDLIKQLVAQVE